MKNPRKPTNTDPAALRRAQRAARGLVAGYIHEISGRHAAGRRSTPVIVHRPAEGS